MPSWIKIAADRDSWLVQPRDLSWTVEPKKADWKIDL